MTTITREYILAEDDDVLDQLIHQVLVLDLEANFIYTDWYNIPYYVSKQYIMRAYKGQEYII